jgi:class 3 adenylate cyclase
LSRVQGDEKNISFSVQSASVLFLDIVSFTPWCGSLPANTVIYTLNRIFVELDKELSKSPSLTEIKCIGDCYMAGCGIFSQVNEPTFHTKEMVQFGIDSIQSII